VTSDAALIAGWISGFISCLIMFGALIFKGGKDKGLW